MIEGVDPRVPTWRAIEKYIDRRIAALHQQLEHPQDETQTALMRGRILELRQMRAAGSPPPEPVETAKPEPPLY